MDAPGTAAGHAQLKPPAPVRYTFDGVEYELDTAAVVEHVLRVGSELLAIEPSSTPLALVARRAGVDAKTLARVRRGQRVTMVSLVRIVVRGIGVPLPSVLRRVEPPAS